MARGGGRGGRGGGRGRGVSKPVVATGGKVGMRSRPSKKNSKMLNELGLSDSDSDDLDAFQRKQDKVSLNMADDLHDDDLIEQDEGVFDLSDEEEDDDDMLEAALERGGRSASLAKQAKQLGRKLKLQQGEGSDGEDDDEEEGRPGADGDEGEGDGWGAKKSAYYDADTAGDHEVMEDKETMKEEEDEVLRMQKARAAKLTAADYGLEEDDEEEDEEDEEEAPEEAVTMGSRAKKAAAAVVAAPVSRRTKAALAALGGPAGRVEVEAVPKDLEGLSAEARMAAVLADSPELLALLQDLQESLAEVRHRVGPALEEVLNQDMCTDAGLSYLEAKHLVLLSYVINIVFYLMLKAEGRSVRDHPVIGRLVELRAYLEKLKPLDKKLGRQLDTLVKAVSSARSRDVLLAASGEATTTQQDDERMAAGALAQPSDEDESDDEPRPSSKRKAGRSRPGADKPSAAAGGRLSKGKQRTADETRRRAARGELQAQLDAELSGAPAADSGMAAIRQRQRRETLAGPDEDDLTARAPLGKDEAARQRGQRRSALAGLADDYADEVRALDVNGKADGFVRHKVSQKFGGEAPKVKGPSGDEDLPRKKELYERRAMFDNIAAKRAAARAEAEQGSEGDDDQDGPGGAGKRKRGAKGGGGGDGEDEMYQAAKAAASMRKASRTELHKAPALHVALPDERTDGQRPISTAIQRNRGLTPHRRKDLKNPRKKNRIRYEGAVMRRKGAVQGVREQSGPYGGEATGIKSNVVKSKGFK